MIIVDSFAHVRAYDVPEIVRCLAVYSRSSLNSEGDIYKPWVTAWWHDEFIRAKLKIASTLREIMERRAPELKLSGRGPADLRLPAVD